MNSLSLSASSLHSCPDLYPALAASYFTEEYIDDDIDNDIDNDIDIDRLEHGHGKMEKAISGFVAGERDDEECDVSPPHELPSRQGIRRGMCCDIVLVTTEARTGTLLLCS